MNMHVAFKRVSKIEATYGRSLVNVKVTSSLSYIASILSTHVKLRDSGNPPLRTIFPPYVRCLYFIYARKNYPTVEIHPYVRSSLHTYVASILSTRVIVRCLRTQELRNSENLLYMNGMTFMET